MTDLTTVFSKGIISAARQNLINDYIENGTHRINTLGIFIGGIETISSTRTWVGNLIVGGDISANNLSGTNTGDQDLSGYQLLSEKDIPNGYPGLDSNGNLNAYVIHRNLPASELNELVLEDGEIAFTNDTFEIRLGDGITSGGKDDSFSSELIVNGTFDTDLNGWSGDIGVGGWYWADGKAYCTAKLKILEQDITTEVGVLYKLTQTRSSNYFRIYIDDVEVSAFNGRPTIYFVATGTTTNIKFKTATAQSVNLDNISVKRLTVKNGNYYFNEIVSGDVDCANDIFESNVFNNWDSNFNILASLIRSDEVQVTNVLAENLSCKNNQLGVRLYYNGPQGVSLLRMGEYNYNDYYDRVFEEVPFLAYGLIGNDPAFLIHNEEGTWHYGFSSNTDATHMFNFGGNAIFSGELDIDVSSTGEKIVSTLTTDSGSVNLLVLDENPNAGYYGLKGSVAINLGDNDLHINTADGETNWARLVKYDINDTALLPPLDNHYDFGSDDLRFKKGKFSDQIEATGFALPDGVLGWFAGGYANGTTGMGVDGTEDAELVTLTVRDDNYIKAWYDSDQGQSKVDFNANRFFFTGKDGGNLELNTGDGWYNFFAYECDVQWLVGVMEDFDYDAFSIGTLNAKNINFVHNSSIVGGFNTNGLLGKNYYFNNTDGGQIGGADAGFCGLTIVSTAGSESVVVKVADDAILTINKYGSDIESISTIKAAGFKSNDGTAGATADVAVAKVGGGTRTLHYKNGLFVGYTDS